ncbi:hypothetical protein CAGA_24100 [Caproiciproducens galactitolivorans]|uniref:Uncharacterized protein n=1 Tax=Caproiciproducens galactitolivorans TaxID=642589 RepID=A0A4Z0Y850_9FIRM|nr:hypothetical protein CAGA_24100 [Caproiciproducens galactitolivorans]
MVFSATEELFRLSETYHPSLYQKGLLFIESAEFTRKSTSQNPRQAGGLCKP